MVTLELTTEQVIALVKQLPPEGKHRVLSALQAALQLEENILNPESQDWLEADFGENLPPYDWGNTAIPTGKSVRYVAGEGLIVEGGKKLV